MNRDQINNIVMFTAALLFCAAPFVSIYLFSKHMKAKYVIRVLVGFLVGFSISFIIYCVVAMFIYLNGPG